MKHKEMFFQHIIRPFYESFTGVFDYLWVKGGLLLAGLPAIFAFDLFSTPTLWWKGLMWLVFFDWLSGTVTAIYRGTFDWHLWTRKLYMGTGYGIVCAMAGILSNTFPQLFYYVQFAVYAAFFLKEFVSALKTWGMFHLFKAAWKAVVDRELDFSDLESISAQVGDDTSKNKGWSDDEKN